MTTTQIYYVVAGWQFYIFMWQISASSVQWLLLFK